MRGRIRDGAPFVLKVSSGAGNLRRQITMPASQRISMCNPLLPPLGCVSRFAFRVSRARELSSVVAPPVTSPVVGLISGKLGEGERLAGGEGGRERGRDRRDVISASNGETFFPRKNRETRRAPGARN
jgi:hypothetical protein